MNGDLLVRYGHKNGVSRCDAGSGKKTSADLDKMLIAPNVKILFIHVNKVAGKSITQYLAAAVDDPDVVTIAGKDRGFKIAGRFYAGLGEHAKAYQVRHALPGYDNYLSFCFARNPWDRAASWYEYLRRGLGLPYLRPPAAAELDRAARMIAEHRVGMPEMSRAALNPFAEFIRTPYIRQRFAEHSFVSYAYDGGTQIVKFIGRFENLEADFAEVCRRARIPAGRLPIINSSNKRPYQSYYSPADIQVIADMWGQDAKLMGYTYG
jgi:hypothetical protein